MPKLVATKTSLFKIINTIWLLICKSLKKIHPIVKEDVETEYICTIYAIVEKQTKNHNFGNSQKSFLIDYLHIKIQFLCENFMKIHPEVKEDLKTQAYFM